MDRRSVGDIKRELEALELERQMIILKKEGLRQELFEAENFEVEWDNAEVMFVNLLSTGGSWFDGPYARKKYSSSRGFNYTSTNISIEELKDGSKQMWLGGY